MQLALPFIKCEFCKKNEAVEEKNGKPICKSCKENQKYFKNEIQ